MIFAQISTYVLLASVFSLSSSRLRPLASHCVFSILLCTAVLLAKHDCGSVQEKAASAAVKLAMLAAVLWRHRRLQYTAAHICVPMIIFCVYVIRADLKAVYGCPPMSTVQLCTTIVLAACAHAALARADQAWTKND